MICLVTGCLRTIYLCKGGEETLLVQMTELRKAELTVFKGDDLENKMTLEVRSLFCHNDTMH